MQRHPAYKFPCYLIFGDLEASSPKAQTAFSVLKSLLPALGCLDHCPALLRGAATNTSEGRGLSPYTSVEDPATGGTTLTLIFGQPLPLPSLLLAPSFSLPPHLTSLETIPPVDVRLCNSSICDQHSPDLLKCHSPGDQGQMEATAFTTQTRSLSSGNRGPPTVKNIYDMPTEKSQSAESLERASAQMQNQGKKPEVFFNTVCSSKPSCLSPKQACSKQAIGCFAERVMKTF